jgi:hypothetical protein
MHSLSTLLKNNEKITVPKGIDKIELDEESESELS